MTCCYKSDVLCPFSLNQYMQDNIIMKWSVLELCTHVHVYRVDVKDEAILQ